VQVGEDLLSWHPEASALAGHPFQRWICCGAAVLQ
jgi:hypothetical protein